MPRLVRGEIGTAIIVAPLEITAPALIGEISPWPRPVWLVARVCAGDVDPCWAPSLCGREPHGLSEWRDELFFLLDHRRRTRRSPHALGVIPARYSVTC